MYIELFLRKHNGVKKLSNQSMGMNNKVIRGIYKLKEYRDISLKKIPGDI